MLQKEIKNLFIFIILLYSIPIYSQTQLPLMPNGNYLICLGEKLKIRAPVPYDKSQCFEWLPTPICSGSNFSYEIEVCPSQTTTYECYWGCGGNKTKILSVKVYVVESLEIREENNTQKCMDQYYNLTFNVDLIGTDINEVNVMDGIVLNRNTDKPDIKFISKLGDIVNGKSTIRIHSMELKMGDHHSFYNLICIANILGLNSCRSLPITVKIVRLWLNKFNHPQSTNNANEWQVVVSDNDQALENIEYEIQAADYLNKFSIEFIDYDYVRLINNYDLTSKTGNQIMVEHYFNPSMNNKDFGLHHGNLSVFGSDPKGNKYYLNTTAEPGQDSKIRNRIPSKKATIFYNKNAKSNKLPYPGFPFWFYFWYEDVVNGKYTRNVNSINYDYQLTSNGYYAATYPNLSNPLPPGSPIAPVDIYVGDLASEKGTVTQETGIRFFNMTVAHECKHAEIWFENWGHKGRYDPVEDTDGDLYNDLWEKLHKNDGFDVRPPRDRLDIYDQRKPLNTGTKYEERLAQDVEKKLNGNNAWDKFDWSYDKTNVYQGKQWK